MVCIVHSPSGDKFGVVPVMTGILFSLGDRGDRNNFFMMDIVKMNKSVTNGGRKLRFYQQN